MNFRLDTLPIARHFHSETMYTSSTDIVTRTFRAETFLKREQFSQIATDFATLKALVHPGLAAYKDIRVDQNQITVQRRFIRGVPLGARLAEHLIPTVHGLTLCIDIAEALQYLHHRDVVCCSIRADDVIISKAEGRAVLVDYGLRAVHLDTIDGARQPMHYAHVGPEGLRGSILTGPTKELDIFNFGLLMYLVFNGKSPWAKCNLPNVMREITEGTIRSSPLLPWGVNDLMMKMLAPDPGQRPTIDEVMRSLIHLRACAQKEGMDPDKVPFRKFSSMRDFGQVLLGMKSDKVITAARSGVSVAGTFASPIATARALPRLQPSRSSRKTSLTPGKPLRPLSGTMEVSILAMEPKDEE